MDLKLEEETRLERIQLQNCRRQQEMREVHSYSLQECQTNAWPPEVVFTRPNGEEIWISTSCAQQIIMIEIDTTVDSGESKRGETSSTRELVAGAEVSQKEVMVDETRNERQAEHEVVTATTKQEFKEKVEESWKEERVWEHEKKDEGALLLAVDEQDPLQAPDNYACEAKEGCSFERALIALQTLEDEFEEHQREKICALKHQSHNFMLQRSEVKAETPVQTPLRAERQVKAVAAQAGEIDDIMDELPQTSGTTTI